MSYLLIFLSVVLSFLSACMMSYISMAIEIAPWVAPVISVTVMIVLLQLVKESWFKEHVVIAIAAGSLGGMTGMCLGFTWPALYFLHPDMFNTWMQSPIKFAGMITIIVLVAGSFAFMITHLLRYHLIIKQQKHFPMSMLVHNIIYADKRVQSFALMVNGLMVSSSWNLFMWISRTSLQSYLSQLHVIPVFLSIGFVAGQAIALPLLVGLFSRVFILASIQQRYFYFEKENSFILTFASGMLFAVVLITVFNMIKEMYLSFLVKKKSYFIELLKMFWNDHLYRWGLLCSILASSIVLFSWGISFAQQVYILIALIFLSHVVGIMIAEVGVLEVASFVSFITLPLTYFFKISSMSALVAVVFCTVCVGVVIDLLFSYKISYLAHITHTKLLQYQILGFIVAACSVGFILWFYIYKFHLGSTALLAQQALEQEVFITFSDYNYQVLLAGMVFASFLCLFISDMLVLIGGFMMPISMSFWLILAGGLSYLLKNREQYYPFWFGVYASHALWMFIRSILFAF